MKNKEGKNTFRREVFKVNKQTGKKTRPRLAGMNSHEEGIYGSTPLMSAMRIGGKNEESVGGTDFLSRRGWMEVPELISGRESN